jgi:hypothetical protein
MDQTKQRPSLFDLESIAKAFADCERTMNERYGADAMALLRPVLEIQRQGVLARLGGPSPSAGPGGGCVREHGEDIQGVFSD